jgi:hypothetical protein
MELLLPVNPKLVCGGAVWPIYRLEFQRSLRFLLLILTKIVQGGVHPHRKSLHPHYQRIFHSYINLMKVYDVGIVEDVLTRLNFNDHYNLSTPTSLLH